MRIHEIAVDHYGPLRDIRHHPKPGLQIFFGPNESGKTLLVDAILRIMLGKDIQDFQGIQRVDQPPQGRVTVSVQGQQHILDGETRLDTVTDLDSRDLRNTFVIRNKDVQMTDQASYLRKISDQLTGMESQRLEQLKKIFRNQGRLTNTTSEGRLSRAQEFGAIGSHVQNARGLVEQIQEYLQKAQQADLDGAENTLAQAKRQLDRTKGQIQKQQQAEDYHKYTQLVDLLAKYQDCSQAADKLRDFTQPTLAELQKLDSQAQTAKSGAHTAEQRLPAIISERQDKEDQLAQLQVNLTDQQRKEGRLEPLLQQVQAEPTPPPVTGRTRPAFGLLGLTALGLVLAGLDLLPPPLPWLPVLSFAGAAILLFKDFAARSQARSHRQKEDAILQQAAAVGIIVETRRQLAAALDNERQSVRHTESQVQALTAQVESLASQQKNLEENHQRYREKALEKEQALKQHLQQLGVADLNEFGQNMAQFNQLEVQRAHYRQQLEKELGTSPADWQQLLDQKQQPLDPGINYDPAALAQLRQQGEYLQQDINKLQQDLNEHQRTLADFGAQCQLLPLEDELGTVLPEMASLEILASAAEQLETFIEVVEQRADNAASLLGILEGVEQEEEEKLADLVGPNRPVQQIFRTITAGRYQAVTMDSQSNIQVETGDGQILPATALSQGTFDQLYLALRLSLADSLLADKPAFLLLDDAFLCADSQRLDRLLAEMSQLAARDWHILYFTMDQRILELADGYSSNPPIRLASLC